MQFFKPKQPILQKKKLSLNSQELALMKCWRIKSLEKLNLCGIYTCIDQAMIIWGVISGIIFFSAQFLHISWLEQGIFWSIITFVGVVIMNLLTYAWTVSEKISRLLHIWTFLMISGVIITDYAIVSGWGEMLLHLCDLWLIISAIGYVITGWILRSKAFFFAGFIHTIAIFILPWFMPWQFALTGLIMMSNLLVFSEGQWDMLLPRELPEYQTLRVRQYSSSSSYSIHPYQLFAHLCKNLILTVLT